ncbi:MAG: HAD-IIIA family hydrolase [Pseudonocardiaceae bacterium]
MSARFSRAVVTGGAGFFGSHLCEQLLRRGTGVICLDNFLTGTPANIAHLIGEPRFRMIKCDVTDFVHVPGEVDLVLHLASAAPPADYLRLLVETLKVGSLGTLHGLGLASEKGARFVLASTSEVYGDPQQHPQRESYWGNVNPVGPRSVTYGPRMRADDGRAIPTFIRQALADEPLPVTGDGNQTRSVCYVDDTVRGILALAESDAAGPVNIGAPGELSITELAEAIIALSGSVGSIQYIERCVDDPQVRCPDDGRFGRAYREDADLALRVIGAGYCIVTGRRRTTHPVPVVGNRAGWLASVRAQRGNADNVLMRRRHGPGWRGRIGDGPGRLRQHALTTAAGVLALGAALCGCRALAGTAALGWAALPAQFALHRILPPATAVPAAVLFDRDGTLIHDVPYNTDPTTVRPVTGVKQALDRLRALGIPVGVVSNQSGVARGLISLEQLEQVNARVAQLLGPFDVLCVCVHAEHDDCGCRKPAPGLVHAAAAQLGVPVHRCVVIGDIGADVTAAAAAGARGILVPNARTRRAEILAVRAARRAVAPDVPTAVDIALSGRTG